MFIIGLDNGICVKSNKRMLTRDMLPPMRYPFSSDYDGDSIEIAYWRKCWNIRNAIIQSLGDKEEYEYEIDTPEQVCDIIEILTSFLNEDKWEDARTIWEYRDMRDTLINQIVNLAQIATFMANNPDIYLVFYDSY